MPNSSRFPPIARGWGVVQILCVCVCASYYHVYPSAHPCHTMPERILNNLGPTLESKCIQMFETWSLFLGPSAPATERHNNHKTYPDRTLHFKTQLLLAQCAQTTSEKSPLSGNIIPPMLRFTYGPVTFKNRSFGHRVCNVFLTKPQPDAHYRDSSLSHDAHRVKLPFNHETSTGPQQNQQTFS
jgi:hypothetical protein